MLAFIWAEDQNHLIGQAGHLPWRLPADLHYLKQTTLESTIVMGRKTFLSFPQGALPHRRNIVLTRQKRPWPQTELASSKEAVEELIQNDPRVFIFGGRSVFQAFLPEVEYLYVTKIAHTFTGDVHMVPIDYDQFDLIKRQKGIVNADNPWEHEFLLYRRRNLEIEVDCKKH
ncbi:dihydrofolate reductase [Lactobacillus sp. DCY120]|uniref:dihydrofolate reductase n=1 Tax=Bombilactobacillus apium TaxID=2675299 RepID=A0A850QVF2_9LACO|nr:dihydrofolate reductase [Bombilactobacillus apium]NVY95764.1 dihydrofolate reductase [Bombilactobacillus apium]